MEILTEEFSCLREGLCIRGKVFRPQGSGLPAVIISHGFGGSMTDEFTYAQKLAQWGYAAFVFDFCGGSPGSSSDGRFRDMTVLTEKADLEAVMVYVSGCSYVDASRLSLMGCSQGGFVSAITAAAHPEQVQKLILFYPAFSIPEDSRRGYMLVYPFDPDNIPDLVEPHVPVGEPFIKEPIGGGYIRCVQSWDAFAMAAAYPGPVLIVHGNGDGAVNVVNSRRAQAAYNALRPRRCQLAEITRADHGFRGEEDVHAMELAGEFLRGGSNILSIDVLLTGCSRVEQDGETVVTIPFGGTCSTPWFSGMVLPGSADVQRYRGEEIVRLCADYVLAGTDYTGQPCRIHVVNENTGAGWHPTVSTDSKALAFLNEAVLTESLESRPEGPVVRIFARIE